MENNYKITVNLISYTINYGIRLGHGSFGTVYQGSSNEDGELFAIKILYKEKADFKDIKNEIKIMLKL